MAIQPITPVHSEEPSSKETRGRKPKEQKAGTMSVRLPLELIDRVKRYRFDNHKNSVSGVVQEALEAYLSKK